MTIGCILTIKCEPCSFGQHPDRRSVHPWAGPEDIAHAVREGHADPTRKPCTCWCSRPPRRIQRQRTAGWRMPEGAVYVGRPTDYGNPFEVGGSVQILAYAPGSLSAISAHREVIDAETAVRAYRMYVDIKGMVPALREDLAGRDLACWCPLDQPCHADVLLELANGDH